jgi:hypothetical protein
MEGVSNRKRAAEIVEKLSEVKTNIIASTAELNRIDGAIGLSNSALFHCVIVTAAIRQIAEGRTDLIHHSINRNIEFLYEIINNAVRTWKIKDDTYIPKGETVSVFERLKRIQEQLPVVIEIATNFVDYSAERAPFRRARIG